MRTSELKGHWQVYAASAVLNLKFLHELAATNDRNFKFTALVPKISLDHRGRLPDLRRRAFRDLLAVIEHHNPVAQSAAWRLVRHDGASNSSLHKEDRYRYAIPSVMFSRTLASVNSSRFWKVRRNPIDATSCERRLRRFFFQEMDRAGVGPIKSANAI